MSHTPGPLRINGDTIMLGRRNIGRAFVTPETNASTALDNARLWGTAPELLEALLCVREWALRYAPVNFWPAEDQNVIITINAAIAKATGGEK